MSLIETDKKTIKTTCAYCGVGCGIEASVDESTREVGIKGDDIHPSNFGRLCSKGSALGETVHLEDRLLHPSINGERVEWDTALNEVATRFGNIIKDHGPDAVAIYGSGQLLTEDYYVANKLMKGFIGTANMDTNSRLCMSSSVVGHKRAFGSDTVPGCYEDLEQADCIILVGSNLAWCHPVTFQRVRAAKEARPTMQIIVIDPRKTNTCDIADLHLPINSGVDTHIFNGLLAYLHQNDAMDHPYINAHTNNFDDALAAALETVNLDGTPYNYEALAAICGIEYTALMSMYKTFLNTKRTVTVYSQGVNQSFHGSDKVNAIINCHLATNRIGELGMGPFSVTGQPNAMGGREVGGLANQLAAHMDFANPAHVDRVKRFWGSEKVAAKPGLPAVKLFEEIEKGNVKAVWVMATNPVVSLPNADKVKRALEKCEFVVVSDCIEGTDTGNLAHVKLPAAGWSEKDGVVTNSERRVSRQRALLKSPGEAKPDWWIISQVAQRLGFKDAFDYNSNHEIFTEHARLSGFENDETHGIRDFNISGYGNLTKEEYDALTPRQWPIIKTEDGYTDTPRLCNNGVFYTPNGKANFLPIKSPAPLDPVSDEHPFILNTGRVRDQWHTMTRTSLSPRLNQHKPEPYVDIHPEDANSKHIETGALVKIHNERGYMIARANVTDGQKPGNIFAPIHWTGKLTTKGRVGVLVHEFPDPFSAQPDLKNTPVDFELYTPKWHGFVLSRNKLEIDSHYYCVSVKGEQFYRYELADEVELEDFSSWAKALLQPDHEEHDEWIEFNDEDTNEHRLATLHEGKLIGCVYVSDHFDLPERSWLATLFVKDQITAQERSTLLLGRPPAGQADVGKIVCACFSVGEKTIRAAIEEGNLDTPKAIGDKLKAGTNCGSCIPELKGFIADHLASLATDAAE